MEESGLPSKGPMHIALCVSDAPWHCGTGMLGSRGFKSRDPEPDCLHIPTVLPPSKLLRLAVPPFPRLYTENWTKIPVQMNSLDIRKGSEGCLAPTQRSTSVRLLCWSLLPCSAHLPARAPGSLCPKWDPVDLPRLSHQSGAQRPASCCPT